jgi:hypothetical protein
MFDLTAASKAKLSDIARQLHSAQGTDVPATSTLMRVSRAELVETITNLLGAQFTINEGGQVVPVVVPETEAETKEVPEIEVEAVPAKVELVTELNVDKFIQPLDDTASGEAAQPEETSAQTDEKPTSPRATGRKSGIPDTAVITVLVEKFPGREGSASMARRKLYRSGMTVAQFLEAADENGRGALRKAVARGWISVSE